jgi:pyridoxal phosphate enzyme (YggS family)
VNRRDEIAANLAEVNEQIEAACLEANRAVESVNLVVVTKTWPSSDIEILVELGITNVGENRDQDARAKQQELAHLPLTWHAIGQIQTNKARSVATWADVVHSIDRPELIAAFDRVTQTREEPLEVLIQIDLDPTPTDKRGGIAPAQMLDLAQQIIDANGLNLAGLMAVAPLESDPDVAFAQLQKHSILLQQHYPEATVISAGMSQDFQNAIKYGATHLRIGSLVLGHRA